VRAELYNTWLTVVYMHACMPARHSGVVVHAYVVTQTHKAASSWCFTIIQNTVSRGSMCLLMCDSVAKIQTQMDDCAEQVQDVPEFGRYQLPSSTFRSLSPSLHQQ